MSKLVELDAKNFNQAIKKLRDHVPNDAKDVVRNEARLLVEELVDRTKPKLGRLKEAIKGTILSQFGPNKGKEAGLGRIPMPIYYRARRGKATKDKLIVQKQVLQGFIKQQQSHAGWFAAGWIGSGNPLKAKRDVPSYVKQQKGEGRTIIQVRPLNIRITVMNNSGFIYHIKNALYQNVKIMQAALKTRVFKINENLKHIKEKGNKYVTK